MIRNYFFVALRNLRKHKLYSFISIGGLAVGLAACLLTILFVRDELSYDRWLPNAERIARLEVTFKIPGRDPMEISKSPGPAGAAIQKDFSSDVEQVTRAYRINPTFRAGDKVFDQDIVYVDPNFFAVFDLPMATGSSETALANNASLLISQSTATKFFFGDAPAVGQLFTVEEKYEYEVVGVFKDLPENTHLQLQTIALFDPARYRDSPSVAQDWTSANLYIYVLFRDANTIDRIAPELSAFANRNVTINFPGFDNLKKRELIVFDLLPLLDIHLHSSKAGDFREGGDMTTVVTFSVIALLILLIACINFTNLATARSMTRAREVAMRKVLGATRPQLVGQFLGEAYVTSLIALPIAIAIAELALGPFNTFLGKELTLGGVSSFLSLLTRIGDCYWCLRRPDSALYLSRFRPSHTLKANQPSATGSTWLRNGLVVFPFAVSISLIVSTVIVNSQTQYARNRNLGFQSAGKLTLSDLPDAESQATLKREILALPSVHSTSLASDAPAMTNNNNTLFYPKATPDVGRGFVTEILRVDHDFSLQYQCRCRSIV